MGIDSRNHPFGPGLSPGRGRLNLKTFGTVEIYVCGATARLQWIFSGLCVEQPPARESYAFFFIALEPRVE